MLSAFRLLTQQAYRLFVTATIQLTETHGSAYWSFLLLGAAGLLAAPCQQAHAGLNSGPEYTALQAFYSATNGASWTTKTGWEIGNACSWYGITCDQDSTPTDNTSHVIQINLSGNNLTGILPALTTLARLSGFDVSFNQLTGTIPVLAGLTNLQTFAVDSNQLTGSIPALNGLTRLQAFGAGTNQLTGSIPALNGLTGLQYFAVFNNQLTGSIPALVGLASLQTFEVDTNQLTGAIPALAGLASLSNFFVNNNQLTGQVPAAPSALSNANLCPNPLDTTPQPSIDLAWDTATRVTPWWATPFANNKCDDIFTDGFEGN